MIKIYQPDFFPMNNFRTIYDLGVTFESVRVMVHVDKLLFLLTDLETYLFKYTCKLCMKKRKFHARELKS